MAETRNQPCEWKLSHTLLNNQWVKEEFTREIRKYLETNGKEHATYQNPWGAKKAVIGGKFIAGRADVKRKGKI